MPNTLALCQLNLTLAWMELLALLVGTSTPVPHKFKNIQTYIIKAANTSIKKDKINKQVATR
jgi:hypothetical protein